MATSIHDNLELVLAGYEDARRTETFGGTHELWGVFEALRRDFAESRSVRGRPSLRVVWSAGKGNWAKVPWISFLDERETDTTRRGVYCVYLFRQDMSGVYLAFQQGVTQPKEELGRLEAHARLRENVAKLRPLCGRLAERGFRLDDGIDLRADPGLGADYESSVVAYKFYEADAVPGDDELLEDLESALRTYDRYLADDKWVDAMMLCSWLLEDRATFEADEIDYKLRIAERIREALDPNLSLEEFGSSLRKAFGNSENNLTNWQAHDRFTKWAVENPQAARSAVDALLQEGEPVERRVDGFLDRVPNEAVSGLGTRISIASFLLMGLDPAEYPMYKPTHFSKVERALGWPRAADDLSPGEAYAHHRAFARTYLEELRWGGSDARDMLDAQSLIWFLASSEDPVVALWRGEEVDPQPALDTLRRWLGSLRTNRSPDGRFHYKPLLLLATLEILDREPGHANDFGYEELRDEFTRLVEQAGSEPSEERFSQPYLRMYSDAEPIRVWLLARPNPEEELDVDKADRPAYVRSSAPYAIINPSVWPAFAIPEARAAVRQEILERWPVGGDETSSWFDPLQNSPLVEAELQRLLEESGRQHQKLLAAIFRRAIFLHQKVGTRGYLGARRSNPRWVSLSIGHVYVCFVVRRNEVGFLVENTPQVTERYPNATPNRSTRGEMLWISTSLDPLSLGRVLEDETLWAAYEGMLAKIDSFPVAHANQDNHGKLDVVTGERLGRVRSLNDLADQLLLDEGFLEQVIELLREKGQAIFYGPPGTGKTYVARKVMEYLAAEAGRREIVQFHPSYSYEDFVQGYRPVTRTDGSLAYELKSGPLMRLAKEAADSPGEHVLLIDEINRGNLPKILGELLYLLEYRDDEVALMYGEDGTRFYMPENLLIIGTMNTADRSIALIDAALRRRFHFVPFFPDEPPLAGLLRRWLTRHRPDMIGVADIVDRLNEQLRGLFGPHLQVGPSHFMRENLDEDVLRRVWDYDVMPFLEDQLYGQEEELERFKLHRLREPGLGEVEHEDHRTDGAPADPDPPDEG